MATAQTPLYRKVLAIGTAFIFLALIAPAYFITYSTPERPVAGIEFLSLRFRSALELVLFILRLSRLPSPEINVLANLFSLIGYLHFVFVIFFVVSTNIIIFLSAQEYTNERGSKALDALSLLSILSVIIHVVQTPNDIGLGSILLMTGVFFSIWGWRLFNSPRLPNVTQAGLE